MIANNSNSTATSEGDDVGMPDTLDEARIELTSIIRSNTGSIITEEEEEVLNLCQVYPALAYERFLYSYGLQVYPLSFLICCSASFETTARFCEEHPNALLQRTNLGYYALHFACENSAATNGLIAFLARKYPVAASKEKLDRQLPIHMLLEQEGASLEDVQSLIEAYPDCMTKRDNVGYTPLQHVFAGPNHSLDVMEYIVRLVPGRLDSFHLMHLHQKTLTLNHAMALSALLPNLKHLNLSRSMRLQIDAWDYLMQALAENRSILHLILSLCHQDTTTTNETVSASLQRALSSMTSLLDLEIYGNDWTEKHCDISDALVSQFSRSQLKFITVKKFAVDHERIFQSLQDNTNLQRFDIVSCVNDEKKRAALVDLLDQHNASIQYVSLNTYGGGSGTYDRINYLIELNHLDRIAARDPNTPLDTFLSLVQDVIGDRRGIVNEKKVRYLYGLLRECPSIWSGRIYTAKDPRYHDSEMTNE